MGEIDVDGSGLIDAAEFMVSIIVIHHRCP